jgi:hypothetical protein
VLALPHLLLATASYIAKEIHLLPRHRQTG